MHMLEQDLTDDLQQQVSAAIADDNKLLVKAGGSKEFYGRASSGEAISITGHSGIINYQPKELVLTVRAGTPLLELEQILAEQGQFLPFEPPRFADTGTIGGAVACGLSGPGRAYLGSVRDFVLGMRLLNGLGQVLHFGGEVMKNVAGYDVSRMVTGSLGTLGIVLETSFKVLPIPAKEKTVVLEYTPQQALERMNRLPMLKVPVSASFYDGERLHIRLSGTESAVTGSCQQLGGEVIARSDVWSQVRDHKHEWFQEDLPLWRLSLPATAPWQEFDGPQCAEWGGALRWVYSAQPSATMHELANKLGGHATLFRGGDRDGDVFHPLREPVLQMHRNMKQAFDPHALFNPGKMYQDL